MELSSCGLTVLISFKKFRCSVIFHSRKKRTISHRHAMSLLRDYFQFFMHSCHPDKNVKSAPVSL